MNDLERYQFDRQGYLHIPGMLSGEEAQRLLEASRALEAEALDIAAASPRWRSVWGPEYWQSRRHGYFAGGQRGDGQTLMVEDFWLFPDAFDFLVGHARTMGYIRPIVQGAIGINNSELRIRYRNNETGAHMGFPIGSKYRYAVVDGQIDCMMVRMVYFLHDVSMEQGPMCFVPGSHRNQVKLPVHVPLVEEPGMVGVPVKAGDAILFTEACRHGGLPNRSEQTRYTLHVGYGPNFLRSQNIATMDEEPNVTEPFLSRLSEDQRRLLVLPRRTRLENDAAAVGAQSASAGGS